MKQDAEENWAGLLRTSVYQREHLAISSWQLAAMKDLAISSWQLARGKAIVGAVRCQNTLTGPALPVCRSSSASARDLFQPLPLASSFARHPTRPRKHKQNSA